MKVNDFVNKLKEIEALPTTYYSVSGGDWAKWNGSKWNFDCVILIKAVLWGWNGNKNASHGGAIYGSNGVYDDGANKIISRCSNVSTDFSNISVGELLWMDGHVGIYAGNGDVIECTAAWESKVLYSKIDSKGRRTRNGRQVYSWKKHGKLKYIDYSGSVEPVESDTNIIYQVYDNGNKKYWNEITNYNNSDSNGYAGWKNAIGGIRAKLSDGSEVKLQVHILGGTWLSKISSNNYKKNDTADGNSYAGIYGKNIDGLAVYCEKHNIKYRVYTNKWYDWVSSKNTNINDWNYGMAGNNGEAITRVQMYIE